MNNWTGSGRIVDKTDSHGAWMIKKLHMEGPAFLRLAWAILGAESKYEDHLVKIVREGEKTEITRKPMPDVAEHLRVDNPVTMANGNQVYRHHGEHCWVTRHLQEVLVQRSAQGADRAARPKG